MTLVELKKRFATFEQALKGLVDLGFEPGIYRRGDVWRAHANVAGSNWAEGENPYDVLMAAVADAEPRNQPKTR